MTKEQKIRELHLIITRAQYEIGQLGKEDHMVAVPKKQEKEPDGFEERLEAFLRQLEFRRGLSYEEKLELDNWLEKERAARDFQRRRGTAPGKSA
jgi:hypothetical protein